MARKTFYEILKDLAPQSTGNKPIIVSMPFLYHYLGKYHVVSLVTGGQSKGEFVRDNRDAGRLVGIAFYHPEEGTGEYLTPTRAKEKYGLDLTKMVGRNSAKLGKDQADDKVTLPRKLDQNIAEKFYKSRVALEDYNLHIMLAAALHADEGKRYLFFQLDPDIVPHVAKSDRRRLFTYRAIIVIMLIFFAILSRGFTAYYNRIVELEKEKSALLSELNGIRTDRFDQEIINSIHVNDYQFNDIIEGGRLNGGISDRTRGKRDAKVTVIIYVDFQCPGCASAWPVFEQLYQDFDNRVTFIQRNYPLSIHEHARIAARAAEAAGQQGYYWQMSDALFRKQSEWTSLNQEKLRDYLQKLFKNIAPSGNQSNFEAALESDDIYKKVSFDYILGQLAHDVSYTPTIIVNGEKIDFSAEGADVYGLTRSAIMKNLEK